MSREAMTRALEALEYIHEGANNQGPHTGISWRCVSNKAEPVITALRQALANEALDKKAENARELGLDYEPAQRQDMPKIGCVNHDCDKCKAQQQEPVARCMEHGECFGGECIYTSPQPSKPWVGLTDEEKSDLWCESTGRDCVNEDTHVFADAIEAKLREKNNG